MPTYDFICDKCRHEFSLTLRLADYEKKKYACPRCQNKKITQQIAAFQTVTSKKS
jgi:putative FmdB family regulatory protein